MTHRSRRTRGSALILVMGVLVLLSIVGTAFVLLMRIELQAARNFVEDTQVQFLAKQALAYCLQHPAWNPPAGADVDNDNVGGPESAWFTYPLSGLASDTSARFAILKKPFGGRVNVNWNGFYIPDAANTDGFQALNEGSSPTEVSLERAIESYLNWLINTYNPFPGALTADSPDIAREIAARICNYRYGQSLGAPPSSPYPVFHGMPVNLVPPTGVTNFPGADLQDDTRFVDDANFAFEPPVGAAPLPPNGRDADDFPSWVAALPAPSLNWRPDPLVDLCDEDGDGLVDEPGGAYPATPSEQVNEPQEFLQFFSFLPLWPIINDDTPFGSTDLQAIISNAGNPPLKIIVNDVLQQWAPAQGYPGYGGAVDYFNWLRPLFTTYNRDYVGDMTPLNHLNLLMPASPTAADRDAVNKDRSAFIGAMQAVLTADPDGAGPLVRMIPADARDISWQILANIVDYADADSVISVLVMSDGWNPATDDTIIVNGLPDAGEPHTRAFHGTERQPYINELWIYNRDSDRFDNDRDGYIDGLDADDSDPANPPNAPFEEDSDCDGYHIELHNQYASPITLYDPAQGIDWYIRVLDSTGTERPGSPYRMSAMRAWDIGPPAQWRAAGAAAITIPAGGYLVIESFDWADSENASQPAGDNATAPPPPPPVLPKPVPSPSTVPAGVPLVTVKKYDESPITMFQPGDVVELVYSYDPDLAGPLAADEAVVDRQHLPTPMSDPNTGTYDFAPSYERQDPRLAVCPRAAPALLIPDDNALLRATAGYVIAETGAPTTGGDLDRNTLGAVNDADDADADPFDGNYDLGSVTDGSVRYDDLVEVHNNGTVKFPNVASLGNILCVGPMPLNPAPYGWSDPAAWLLTRSPYTAVPDPAQARALDAKKVNFIDPPPPTGTRDPIGRASAIFDKFTTWCPWKDGKDNDNDWDLGTDDIDGNGGPTPGDPHVDENPDEVYVYGRIPVNEDSPSGYCAISALPFTAYDNNLSAFDPLGINVPNFYLTVRGTYENPPGSGTFVADPNSIEARRNALPNRRFTSRGQFYDAVVRPLVSGAVPGANFGRDTEDNQVYESGGSHRRPARPAEWGTIQRMPRTATTTAIAYTPPMFLLPGQPSDGGDLLVDDKSEIDYTVGALMNMVAIESELPQDFAAVAGTGIITYYITVQITDGNDVDGIHPDGTPSSAPDWNEGTVRAEKRIVVLVNTALPTTDPQRIRIFNWAAQGRYSEK